MNIKKLMDLTGRTVLITGAAGHIGFAIAQALAEAGAAIAALDVAKDECRAAAEKIEKISGVKSLPLTVDLSDEDAVLAVPQQVLDNFGGLDILVNCAALVGTSELKGWATPLEDQSTKAWRMALEINLTAPFVLTQACAKALATGGHGSVINIGSIYGMVGPDMRLYEDLSMGNPAAYAAGKGGLIQLTRYLATVMAPKVRVNAICAGGVSRAQPEEFQSRYIERTPLGRMAVEEDFIGAALYLASDLSAYVTGHNLVVDGGWTAW